MAPSMRRGEPPHDTRPDLQLLRLASCPVHRQPRTRQPDDRRFRRRGRRRAARVPRRELVQPRCPRPLPHGLPRRPRLSPAAPVSSIHAVHSHSGLRCAARAWWCPFWRVHTSGVAVAVPDASLPLGHCAPAPGQEPDRPHAAIIGGVCLLVSSARAKARSVSEPGRPGGYLPELQRGRRHRTSVGHPTDHTVAAGAWHRRSGA